MAYHNIEEVKEAAAKLRDDSIIKFVKFLTKALGGIMRRVQLQNDPVLRYSLLLDKFALLLDLGFAGADTACNTVIPSDLYEEMQKVFNSLQEEMDNLGEYIKQPHLNPDHPVGAQFMKQGEKKFNATADSINTVNIEKKTNCIV